MPLFYNDQIDLHAYNPYERLRVLPRFELTSPALEDGAPLAAAQYGSASGGQNISPELHWSGFPSGTKSFVVTCYDPDAPTGSGFWHWGVANIPVSVISLAANAGEPESTLIPAGAITLQNDGGRRGFNGCGAPEGTGVHRYIFAVHSLDTETLEGVDESTGFTRLGFLLNFNATGRALLTGTGFFGGAA
ncbi:MAG: YbhB/YbcL family Raf kinase inhibitor-like protein [Microbacteriaceae bacterium]